MKYSILQLDLCAGDLAGNARKIIEAVLEEDKKGTNFCVTPELALIGYVPCDFLRYPAFLKYANKIILELANRLSKCACGLLLGSIGQGKKGEIYNTACYIEKGNILEYCAKKNLRDSEKAYFSPDAQNCVLTIPSINILACLGEDYIEALKKLSACECDCLVNMSYDVYSSERAGKKQAALASLAKGHNLPILYANAAGACDSKIFAGASAVLNSRGQCEMASLFGQQILEYDQNRQMPQFTLPPVEEQIFSALSFGLREYCRKTGIGKIVLGLSGGIDSALVAAIACNAMGAENVLGLLMPSPWSSSHSLTDARELASNLGMVTFELPIGEVMEAYKKALQKPFTGMKEDVTEENIQARIRGNLVMALANKQGAIAVATGNKSEILVGYCTMYGDTCGALAVIGDLYKTEVYRLCRWLNSGGNIIPENILTKAPSAELKPGQTDQDSLPPYDILDAILAALVDRQLDERQIINLGYEAQTVKKVVNLVAKAQFKRRQMAPILMVHEQMYLNMPICGKLPFEFSSL